MLTVPPPTSARNEGGMMLEALISLLIFTIGILAIVGLQATSLRNTVDARDRMQASLLAEHVVGLMWADRKNLATYASTGQTCSSSPSTHKEQWLCAVEAQLPGVGGPNAPLIEVETNGNVRVTLRWQKSAADLVHRYVVETRIAN